MGSLAAREIINHAQNAVDLRPKYALFHMTEMTADNAKRQMILHGKVRCQPVGPSLILWGR